jgi:hypothetical protein
MGSLLEYTVVLTLSSQQDHLYIHKQVLGNGELKKATYHLDELLFSGKEMASVVSVRRQS